MSQRVIRPRIRQGKTLLVAAVILGLVAAGCGGNDDDTDRATPETTTSAPAPGRPDDTSAPTTTPVPEIAWEGCGNAECAAVAVPLDHDDPDGETIELFVKRLPATGDRIGSLFVNPGGPGGNAAGFVERLPIPEGIRARFDIVGIDPRGVGSSTPISCGLDPSTLYSADPTIEDQADAAALVEISERYAADCEAKAGPLLPHLGTLDVARDMDLIRAGMGDEQLSYLGFSYGTSIGQAYAELFPDRVRAMVLDGVVDPAPSGVETAAQQAEGFETALANWAAGCGARPTCRFDDPIGAVDRMLAAAESTVPSTGGARALGPGEAAVGLAFPLYQQALWSVLDDAVADANEGDGTGMVALADDYGLLVDFSIYFAVSCLDSSWPTSTEEFLDAAEAAGEASPRFGEAIVNDYIRCAVWPTPPKPLGAVEASASPPILVVSTTGDPATPYESGVRVAERLASGVLLTVEGEGHTIVFQQASPCVDTIAAEYLLDLEVPPDGSRC